MQDEQRTEQQQFNLFRFLSNSARFLRYTWWIVIVATILGAVLFGVYARQTFSPRYQSRAVLSVHLSDNTVTDIISGAEKTGAGITKQIVKTFPVIIKSDAMMDRIQRDIGQSKINGTITPMVIADSNLFTITVSSSSPQDAYDILNSVIKNYPEMAFIFIGAARIEVIEEPVVPTEPANKLGVLLPTVLGGLGAGLLVLLILCLLGQLQTTIRSSIDLQRYTNVPCIVHVPQTVLKRRSRGSNQLSLLNSHLPASFEESIRVLRSRLLRQIREKDLHKIIITSTVPGEGKSTIAANLALSFSHSNMRVVLIDADLRTQELKEFFDLDQESLGLSDLLQDRKLDPNECLIPVPDTNVKLLCGSTLDRPVTLLRRGRLGRIMERLQEEADLVLIDTPPIGLLTDAASFAQYADGAVYVVRADVCSGNRIVDGMQAIADCKTPLLGYVLNGVSARMGSHGYGYRYSYGYGYGSYGNNYAAGYSSSYRSDYGSYGGYNSYGGNSSYGNYGNYGSYGSYGSYGGYGGYGGYAAAVSASQQQKSTEKSARRRRGRDAGASEDTERRHGIRNRRHRSETAGNAETENPAVPELTGLPAETVTPAAEAFEAPAEIVPETVPEALEAEQAVKSAVESAERAAGQSHSASRKRDGKRNSGKRNGKR